MKKNLFPAVLLVMLLLTLFIPALAAKDKNWDEKPVITNIYELANEKAFLEWEGKSDLYQVYVDGKNAATVNLKYAIVDLKNGVHQISVVPIDYVSKEGSKDFSFDVNVSGLGQILSLIGIRGLGNLSDISAGLNIDLSAFGIDPKDLIQGNPSEPFRLNYTSDPVFTAVPEIISADMDLDENVTLTFTDKYNSDIYTVFIKSGSDLNTVEFDTESEEASKFITKNKTAVSIKLDPEYLRDHACLVPELDHKYSFSVRLQKWPVNLVDGSRETSYFITSKESKAFRFTPFVVWKTGPVITCASQTADGQVVLQWEHEDYGFGCEYKIIRQDMLLGVKKGEREIGRTSEKEFVIDNLMNGNYAFAVVPLCSGEQGFASKAAAVEVKNSWAAAPPLKCEQSGSNQVLLKWRSLDGIDSYHITVSVGDGSLLKYVNLDYKKYQEFDVPAETGNMQHTYTYDRNLNTADGVDLKFEIYGVHYTAEGLEQRSSTAVKTIKLR